MTKSDAIKVIEMMEKKGNVTTEEVKEIVRMIDEPISYSPAPIIVNPSPYTPNPYYPTVICTSSTDEKTEANT